jgi:acrylyl-CoA reductase (NADPH)
MKNFQAYLVEQTGEKEFTGSIKNLDTKHLPDGEVLVRVLFSSLNYKDALSATGNRGVTRNYPHTPGIDAAGIVEQCATDQFSPGDNVIVTSYDLGMNTSGGFGQYICVPSGWVVKLPEGLSLKESMMYGTAGFTAGMAVWELLKSVLPDDGEILVTGASGGVGSMSVAILSKLGFRVVAVSGKQQAHDFLLQIGVSEIIQRQAMLEGIDRPLLKPRWAGIIDTVGGEILANAIKAAKPLAVIAACGNAASADLPLNVFPFILRGVKLVGIDSQNCPMTHRRQIWQMLAAEWKPQNLNYMVSEIGLQELQTEISKILKGEITGRKLVNLS